MNMPHRPAAARNLLSALAACTALSSIACVSHAAAQPPAVSPTAAAKPASQPDPRLAWWSDTRFGMFIHFGLYAVPAGKWGDRTDHAEWIRHTGKIPREEYETLLTRFNPSKFDANAIVAAAKDAGMGYIAITSKHHDGFALFDSKTTDWDVMSTPFKRDIMKEMSQACAKQDVKMCWYYSIMDWHHPDYLPRRDWEKWSTDGADFNRYVGYMKDQLRELLSNYGPIGVLWFDGQWEHNWTDERGMDMYKYVRGLQPDIIVNSRVGRAGGSYGLERESGMLGDYATPEQVIPDRVIADQPWETCMTMNGNWGYNAADNNFKSTTDLIRKLAEIAGKGGNFLLNVGPDAKGEIPAQSLAHLKEIGTWMRTHSDSIKGTIAGPFDKTPWGSCTQKKLANGDTRLFLHVFDWPTDGRLTIPGLLSEPRAASLLGAPANTRVTASRRDDAVILTLPPAAERNPHDNVIVLDVAGEANVAVAPTITAFSDIFLGSTPVAFSTPQKGVQLRYTTDGSDPVATSPLANQVVLTGQGEGSQVKVRGFLNGKAVSPVATRKFEVANLWPARKTRDGIPDIVTYEYYEGAFKSVADFDKASPVKTGDTPGFDLSVRQKESNWGIKYHATIQVPKDGVYRFFLSSDDGSTLQVDGKMVVNNDKDHSYKTEKGDAPLAAGLHDIELRMYENSGGFALKLEWESPDAGLKRQEVRPLTQ